MSVVTLDSNRNEHAWLRRQPHSEGRSTRIKAAQFGVVSRVILSVLYAVQEDGSSIVGSVEDKKFPLKFRGDLDSLPVPCYSRVIEIALSCPLLASLQHGPSGVVEFWTGPT